MKYIFTDLDKTLIPNGNAPYDNTLNLFFEITNKNNLNLIYVSGRNLASIVKSIKKYNLKKPLYIISHVGTKIYSFENKPIELIEWIEHITKSNSNWNRDKISEITSKFDNLKLQAKTEQSEFKISYFVTNYDSCDLIKEAIENELKKEKIEFNIVFLKDFENRIVYLDILPKNVNKYEAIKFLSNEIKIKDFIYCGDSGNDLDILTSNMKSILVNNASIEIKNKVVESKSNCYICSGKFGFTGNYSSGIIEGLIYYKWIK